MELFWILYSEIFDDIDITGLYLVCLKKMMPGKTLFDDDSPDKGNPERPEDIFYDRKKETIPLERLKNLEEKIAAVVIRVKALKEEKKLPGKKDTGTRRVIERKEPDYRVFDSREGIHKDTG